jgi:hypothetical protein
MCGTDETSLAATQGCSTLGVLVSSGSAELAALGIGELSDPRGVHADGEPEHFTIGFPRIDDGDCTLFPSTFWVYSNGTAALQGYVATDDSGDVWLVRGMALLDRNGVELYRIPQFNGPEMDMPDHNYAFNAYPLYYPAYLYPYVTNARMYHHC